MRAWLFPIRDPITPGKPLSGAFARPLRLRHTLNWGTEPDHASGPEPHPVLPPPDNGGHNHGTLLRGLAVFILSQTTHYGRFRCLDGRDPSPDLESVDAHLLAILRRHVFETSRSELRPRLPRGYRARTTPTCASPAAARRSTMPSTHRAAHLRRGHVLRAFHAAHLDER